MMSNEIDKLIDNLITILPGFYKKLEKMRVGVIHNKEISKAHIQILYMLKKEGKMNMSSLGKKLIFRKPNVTYFVDQLIELDLVKREYSKEDRRIVLIALTDKGAAFAEEYKKEFRKKIQSFVSKSGEHDLEILRTTLKNLVYLLSKFDDSGDDVLSVIEN